MTDPDHRHRRHFSEFRWNSSRCWCHSR